jgi:hypothetical protein
MSIIIERQPKTRREKIVSIVGTHNESSSPTPIFDMSAAGRLGFGAASGLSQSGDDHQAMAIVHLGVPCVA